MKTFTLYGLNKPGEEARYIGITSGALGERLDRHLRRRDGSPHKDAWIAKMRSEGLTPEIVPYCINLTKEDAGNLEALIISGLRSLEFDLVNTAPGGGYLPDNTGRKHSLESRQRRSVRMRGEGNHFRGRKLSEDHKRKIGLASLGRTTGNTYALGLKHTEEAKEKIGAASRGNDHALGHQHSVEAREEISTASKLMWEKRRQEFYLAEMWGSRG